MDEKKALLYGVEYPAGSGQLHYDFELRLPTVGDNIAAIEAHGIGSNMRINTAMLASCLVKLGDIPAEAITYELLEQQMVDDDYDVLAAERDRLKKADEAESLLGGFRLAVVALGKHGIPESRIRELNATEFEGYLAAVNQLYGGKPSPGKGGGETRHIRSQRKKKPR